MTDKKIIQIPYKFEPRVHQLELLKKLETTSARHYILVWHRRAGKDVVSWVTTIVRASQKVGLYLYIMPEYVQARKVIWNGIDNDGRRLLDLIPKELIARISNQEMSIKLINGSIIQLAGADKNPDALRGTNPAGCVMSEYAQFDATFWPMIMAPIFRANNGWAIFNSTPDGPNHYYDLVKRVGNNPEWLIDIKNIRDTGVMSEQDVQNEIDSGLLTKEQADQEYYCKFNTQASGSVLGDLILKAKDTGRVGNYDYDPSRYVDTYWDLGINDDTAAWFVQRDGARYNVVDYYEGQGQAIRAYVDMLQEKGYRFRYHFLPHDGNQRHHGIDQVLTTAEMFDILLQESKLGKTIICPKPSRKVHAINGLRSMFNAFHFHEPTVRVGLRKLEMYRRKFDAKRNVFSTEPVHDGSSHAADAFLNIYLAKDMADTEHVISRRPRLLKTDNPLY